MKRIEGLPTAKSTLWTQTVITTMESEARWNSHRYRVHQFYRRPLCLHSKIKRRVHHPGALGG